MRTDEEILARIEAIKSRDFFGFESGDLIARLPFEKAKPFLVDTAKAENWVASPRDRGALLKEMHEYMPFAWTKANDCRGTSAVRSLDHYRAWVWLAEHDEDAPHVPTEFQYYGKDELVKICKHYGWDHAQWDDGVRTNG